MVASTQLAPARRKPMSMCTPDVTVYPLLLAVVETFFGRVHEASLFAVTDVVWAILCCQSLHPADVARALPGLQTAQARQAMRRVRRLYQRRIVRSEALTPLLLRVVLRLVAPGPVTLVLDSTRCGPWEIFSVGACFSRGRVLPLAWTILPYPWPKKQFTPTVIGLLTRLLATWPAERPLHVVADRGFPSVDLFKMLSRPTGGRQVGFTIRLRMGDYVALADGRSVAVGALLDANGLVPWRSLAAVYVRNKTTGPASQLVIGREEPIYPSHQRGPGDQARRASRAAQRAAYLRRKGQPNAIVHDGIWALLTTETTAAAAVTQYRKRFSTEGMYQDWMAWDLEMIAAREPDPTCLDSMLGIAALTYIVQSVLGEAAGRTRDPALRARQHQWTTTDRLSVAWRGRQVLHDHAFSWPPFVRTVLADLRDTLASPILGHSHRPDACSHVHLEAA